MLGKTPGFTFVAVLTVALGIGATTAIFSIVDAVLLHPLAYPNPDQLVRIEDDLPGVGERDVGMSVPECQDFQRSGIFDSVAQAGVGDVNLTGASHPERIRFRPVSPNYFELLDVKPQLGRAFSPGGSDKGFSSEVLISDGLWKRDFAGDPGILGKTLRLDNDLYRVVGVMPPSFHDPGRTPEERATELWAAWNLAAATESDWKRKNRNLLTVFARIKPGQTIAATQNQLSILVASLQKQFREDYSLQSAWTVRLIPLKETVVGDVRQSLIVLLGAVGLVLLVGCVSVANLLLARASTRNREMAVRQAVGASQIRLISQLVTEGVLLSLLGGIVGLGILFLSRSFLLRLVPDSIPRLDEVSINWTVLLFALVASFFAGAIFGAAPALQVSKLDLNAILKRDGRGSTISGEQSRARRVLVVTQFALSLVLLIAAGLLLRSLWGLLALPPGFNPRNVVVVRTWLPIPNDPSTDIYGTVAQENQLLREIVRRASSLPEVEEVAVGGASAVPLGHIWREVNPYPLMVEGHEYKSNEQPPPVIRTTVSPAYFHLLGMTLLRGQLFSDSDDDKVSPVAVINEALARTYWPGANAVGQHLKRPEDASWTTVIGVIANARTESLADAPAPQIYLNAYQKRVKNLVIFVRGGLDTAAIAEQLREQVQAVNPELPVFGAETLDKALSTSLDERRFSMNMVGLFALTALLLAALGVYGVTSYFVTERTHEIGIRLALGAQRRNILRMVLRQGLRLALAGVAVGLPCAFVVSKLMAGFLYGVKPTDPVTFVIVSLVLVGVALLACYIPARRAIHVDPLVALKYE